MTKQEFSKLIQAKTVILDGATGSNLQKRGMPTGICPELWVSEHPDVLIGLQKEYAASGSNIIYASTFSGNRIKLAEYGIADRLAELNKMLIQISKEAAEGKAYVAADITMTGAQLEPIGDLTFDELVDVYEEQIGAAAEGGADLIIVETMMSLQETRAAVLAAKTAAPELPIMVTLSFAEAGSTLYGASCESCVAVLQQMGVDAVGLNCSCGPDKMIPIVKRMKSVARIPVIAKPNAGLPEVDAEGNTVYNMNAADFAEAMKDILTSGAQIVGGCCGTTPDHIAELTKAAAAFDNGNQAAACRADDNIDLADTRNVYSFEPGQVLELGEGIDFASDEDMLEEAADEIYDTAQDTAFDLQDDEADALLFTAEGVDDAAAILAGAIADVTSVVRMPVVLGTSDPAVAETVLRSYCGIAALKPLTEEADALEALKNVAKRYHAALVSLDNAICNC